VSETVESNEWPDIYRSKYESEERYQQRVETRKRLAANIQEDIDKNGIAAVLADILADPVMYRIQKS